MLHQEASHQSRDDEEDDGDLELEEKADSDPGVSYGALKDAAAKAKNMSCVSYYNNRQIQLNYRLDNGRDRLTSLIYNMIRLIASVWHLYGLYWCFYLILIGRRFTIKIDHEALCWVLNMTDVTGKLA